MIGHSDNGAATRPRSPLMGSAKAAHRAWSSACKWPWL